MIPVYIGSSARFEVAERLTAASILANTEEDVDIRILRPEWHGMREHGCTGFTNCRFAVPGLLRQHGYEFGIYLDVDMLVLGDIKRLFHYRRPGVWVGLADGSTEVSVVHRALMYPRKENLHRYKKWELRPRLLPLIPMRWNVEDRIEEGMQLLHLTNLETQPWFHDHPDPEVVEVFQRYMAMAHAWNPGARWTRSGCRVVEYGHPNG